MLKRAALTISLLVLPFLNDTLSCEVYLFNNPRDLCTLSDAIVVAQALFYDSEETREGEYNIIPEHQIVFETIEVLKGDRFPKYFYVNGLLIDTDEFRDSQVPYTSVRPSGRRGSCFAVEYKRKGLYLLFLTRDTKFNYWPYWGSMNPTNEQLRSLNDPWLKWIKEFINENFCSSLWDWNAGVFIQQGLEVKDLQRYFGSEFSITKDKKAITAIIEKAASTRSIDNDERKQILQETDYYISYGKNNAKKKVAFPSSGDIVIGIHGTKVIWCITCYGSSPLQRIQEIQKAP